MLDLSPVLSRKSLKVLLILCKGKVVYYQEREEDVDISAGVAGIFFFFIKKKKKKGGGC